MSSTFVSYVSVAKTTTTTDDVDRSTSEHVEPVLKPMLLPGEVIVAAAERVLKFTALSKQNQGIIGSLFVTNFKLSFVTADASYKQVDQTQQNLLLGPNDVCLFNIDSVYQVSESTHKRRKLEMGSSVDSKVKNLLIICRDFRVFTFSFMFALIGEDRGIANALLHYAIPMKSHRLFAYEYKDKRTDDPEYFGRTRMFNNITDWEDELERLQCAGFRVTSVNKNFMSKTQPQFYVVPSRLLDSHLTSAASHYPGYRIPFWCWGNKHGCAIVRSACHTRGMYSHQIYEFIKAIKQIHPLGRDPRMVEVEDALPNLREIYLRFNKLKDMCTPDTEAQFWEQDTKFNSLLETTQWLPAVSACLNVANLVVDVITSHRISVVLQETEDRDLSCLVSSLAQIMLDPYFRTIAGFQSLVQKEWVAMGHPFLTRLGRIRTEDQESPLFLLFLDCVWQMTQQFPSSFEYTEVYLTTVWDSIHMSVFDTYLFDCELDRRRAAADHIRPLMLRRVWDWSIQYSRKQTSLFLNPLFSCSEDIARSFLTEAPTPPPRRHSTVVNPTRNGSWSPATNHSYKGHPTLFRSSTVCNLRILVNHLPDVKANLSKFLSNWPRYGTLVVRDELPMIQLWRFCYFRWMPLVEIVGGGSPISYMQQCCLVKEVKTMQRKIASFVQSNGGRNPSSSSSSSNLVTDLSLSTINLSQQSADNRSDVLTSAYPFSPGGIRSTPGVPLSFFRQSSYIASDEDLEDE